MMKRTVFFSFVLAAVCQTAMAQSGKTTYEYDKMNRLVRVVSPAGETTYTYDAVGNRKTKQFTPNAALKPASAAPAPVPADTTTVQQPAVVPENREPLATKEEESETKKP